ncbi:hypothetical protein Taro_027494, partial [Colocasia esculenta]|nr:hypothetical protein [Colocasia esculenta]
MANVAPEAAPPACRREEYVLCSGVRSGLKREFVFALKAQAEMLMTPMSRTRSGKIQRSPAHPQDGSAKRRRKSEGADATAARSKAAEASPIIPAPGDAATQGMAAAVAEAAMAVNSGPEPVMDDAMCVAASSVEVNGCAAEDSVSMQIENPAVVVTPPTGPVVAGATADTVPSVLVGAGILMDTPRTIQDEAEAVKDSATSIQVGNEPMVETLQGIQVEAEATADSLLSCQEDARPAVELLQTTQSEAEPMVGTPPIQADAGPMTESPQTIPMEMESGAELSTEVAGRPEVDSSQRNQIKVEAMPAKVPSVQMDARPVPLVEKPQIAQIETEARADMTPSIQVEARPVMEVRAEIGRHVPRKAKEHATIEKPMRRFTRSLLKAAVKEPQPPVVEVAPVLMAGHSPTTSSVSDGSEENKDSVDTMNGPHKSPCMTPKKKLELKMSKKIALTKFPSNIRGLLATGLLDGLSVKYGTPSFHKREGLRGVIKDGGILCFCASCKGLKTISAYNFELHAGSKKKHPSDFIYLENGNTIHDVLRACSNAPLDMLESTIQNAISIEGSRSSNHEKCKESSTKSRIGKLASARDSSLVAKLSPGSPNPSAESISTARDLRLHKLVFMDNILPDGTEVAYYARGQRLLQGYIKGSGIFCHCCKTVVSPSVFEAHAGWASRRKPYLNIYTSNGVSLHELSISLSKGKKFSTSESDDLCRICADGGDLLLCDLCPRAFHKGIIACCCFYELSSPFTTQLYAIFSMGGTPCSRWRNPLLAPAIPGRRLRSVVSPASPCRTGDSWTKSTICRLLPVSRRGQEEECVGLTSVPKGDWYCPCCQNMHLKDKAVEHNENAVAAGRVAGVDPIEEIFKRCIRIVKTPEADVGGCVLCRCHDFSARFGPRTVLLCDQCEREFHVGCLKDYDMGDLKLSVPQSDLIKKKNEQIGLAEEINHDVRWRLLSGKTASSETRLLLSAALSIFHSPESGGLIPAAVDWNPMAEIRRWLPK